jgi:ferredoxin-NADP reductase
MPAPWYEGHISRIEKVTAATWRFWVAMPEGQCLDFRAGQFVTMDLPIHERKVKRWRSYSIASPPHQNRELEFCIVRLEGGAASQYFFEEVEVGTPIRFRGPSGKFVLPEPVDRDLVFICTGTGVAPFRSMLTDLHHHRKAHRRIHLIFGTRYAEGILYRDEFEQLLRELPDFRYSMALSREPDLQPETFPFPVRRGYVHPWYLQEYASPRPDIDFYLCGWRNMIDEALDHLSVRLGYEKTQIHFELYG